MRYGLFRQGTGKPSQGCQLRGSSPLTQGLVSCVVFSDAGDSGAGPSTGGTFGAPIDITGYGYNISSPLLAGNQGHQMDVSPWGAARSFSDGGNDWISYVANQAVLDQFPQGANPRTLAALVRFDPASGSSSQFILNYGANASTQLFSLTYSTIGPSVGNFDIGSGFAAPFTIDGDWHLLAITVPPGAAHIADCLIYIDGMPVTGSLVQGSNIALNTTLVLNRTDESYAIGNRNYGLNLGNSIPFTGLMAGAWVWNYALDPDLINLLWRDPFHMIARPRSLSTIDVLSPPPVNIPTCSISAFPNVINPGDTSVLTWTTTNTPTTATIDNGIGSVDPTGGSVSVSPTSTTTYVLTVSNSDGTSTCTATVIVQSIPGPLAGQCNNPPAGKVGLAYSHTFIATGGVPPYTYAITAGQLPFGLTLASNGVISGTPTVSGVYFFTVTSTDSNGLMSSFSCNIPIAC